ncbi:uncharacterized protein LOC122874470 [Siniperca chuatsi]|uniref:uncharacterized protein LOC122874470 n=1 Tax=Siniperca chuatsi TaxID=119488 RepID=UPI001CE21179|nr:uncharacterized protein LOC122874470 [Siniperca chuatsi]
MRVLWISCLLIGSISCGPVGKDDGSNSADMRFMQQPSSSGYFFSGRGVSSDLGSSSPLPSLPNPRSFKATEQLAAQDPLFNAGPGSYVGSQGVYSSRTNMAQGNEFDSGYTGFGAKGYNSPEVSEYGVPYAASQATGYDSSAYVGDSSSGFVAAPQDENSASSYGASDEALEPVFSDVSDLEPVYSFSSRSRYQRGRAVFVQTRYTPGEPVPPLMPIYRRVSKTAMKQSSPAKAPTKGGF